MKYSYALLLLITNLILQSTPEYPKSTSMEEEKKQPKKHVFVYLPHQNRVLPTCSEITECLYCCCASLYVLGCIAVQIEPNMDTVRKHGRQNEHRH